MRDENQHLQSDENGREEFSVHHALAVALLNVVNPLRGGTIFGHKAPQRSVKMPEKNDINLVGPVMRVCPVSLTSSFSFYTPRWSMKNAMFQHVVTNQSSVQVPPPAKNER